MDRSAVKTEFVQKGLVSRQRQHHTIKRSDTENKYYVSENTEKCSNGADHKSRGRENQLDRPHRLTLSSP